MPPAITTDNFGAWIIKCNPHDKWDLKAWLDDGHRHVDGWTVGKTYRAGLMQRGDPVVLWVSGNSRRLKRGIWGLGHVTAPAEPWDAGGTRPGDLGYWHNAKAQAAVQNYVGIDMDVDDVIVTDAELKTFGIDDLEVHRIPQMTNPSFLTVDEVTRLTPLLHGWSDPTPPGPIVITEYGAGFGDADHNRLVEQAAVAAVIDHYEQSADNWRLDEDLQDMKVGLDLTFSTGLGLAKVEVKGVSGTLPQVLLTANEHRAAQEEPDWYLAVVTEASTDPQVHEYTAEQAVRAARAMVYQVDLRGEKPIE